MAEGGRQARLDVGPDRAASHQARQWARATVEDWGLGACGDDLEVVVGELIVNVVLHADTPATVVLRESGPGVRLEVTDRRPDLLPIEAGSGLSALMQLDVAEGLAGVSLLDAETTTGRGLLLVAGLSDSWGVEVGPDAKTVWAHIGGSPRPDAPGANQGETGVHAVAVGTSAASAVGTPVRLVGIPARLVLTSAANLDDLVREFRLAAVPGEGFHEDLADLAERFLAMTTGVRQPFREAAVAAVEEGRRLLDVRVDVPGPVVPSLRAFRDVVDEIVRYCDEGNLLSIAPAPEITAFRRWYVDEIERQFEGAPPRACPFPVLPADDPALAPAEDAPARSRPPRAGWLDSAAESLRHARAVASIIETAVNAAASGMGASSGSLCLLEDDGFTVRLVQAVAYGADVEGHWQTFQVGDDLPASEAIRTGEAIFLRTVSERNLRYPVFASTPVVDDQAVTCLPIDRGCLVVGFAEPRAFDEEERRGLLQLAYLVSEALIALRTG